MKKKSTSQSAFFNLRVLIGLVVFLAGVFLALLGFGAFSNASAQVSSDQESAQWDPLAWVEQKVTASDGAANSYQICWQL